MITGRQIVCLSSVPWSFLPTSRHHLARIFAEHNDVLFVDPPANLLRFGRDRAGESGRLVARGAWGRLHREEERLHRLAPAPRLPYGGNLRFAMATPINQRRYAASVVAAVQRLGFHHPVLWDVTMVYFAPFVAARVRPSVHIVHMTDDLWSYEWYRPEYDGYLRRELDSADFAVGTTPEIAARLADFGVPAHVVGHGVDVDRFAPSDRPTRPTMLEGLASPLVGFAGNIEARVDVDLVERLAAAATVVLLGPVHVESSDRRRLESAGVVLPGPVDYEVLPAHLAALDVGIVPYRTTDLVRRSRPLKLLEMLAVGLPVVCTDMPAARELQPEVRVAGSHDEFVRAVAEEHARPTTTRAARIERARGESWRTRADELSALIEAVERTRHGD